MMAKSKEKETVKSKQSAKKKIPHNVKAEEVTNDFFNPDEVIMHGDERPSPSVEIFKVIMEQTYSKADIALKTELNDKQIVAFTTAELFSKRYHLPLLGDLVVGHMEKNVSRGRKGRKEWADVAKASFQSVQAIEQEQRGTIPDRLLGRR